MFQVSYFVFVLFVGAVTGAIFGASRPGNSVTRTKLVLLGISACVALGFFARFGFGWGIVTVVELAFGFLVGLRLTSPKQKSNEPTAAASSAETGNEPPPKVVENSGLASPANLGPSRASSELGSRQKATQVRSIASRMGYVMAFVLIGGIFYMGWDAAQTPRRGASDTVPDHTAKNIEAAETAEIPLQSPAAAAAANTESQQDLSRDPVVAKSDISSLMLAVYPAGPPEGVAAIGTFEQNNRVGLIVGADGTYDCHACSGKLSAYYFTRRQAGAGLVEHSRFVDFMESGSWGQYSRDVQMRGFADELGQPIAGMIHQSGYVAQGYLEANATVILFYDDGPREALSVPMDHDCGDERAGVGVDAEIVEGGPSGSTFAIQYRREDPQQIYPSVIVPYRLVASALIPMTDVPEWVANSC